MISIHALREEGDRRGHTHAEGADNFYPRPPRGGRPPPLAHRAQATAAISIHALREEGDPHLGAGGVGGTQISIHALREEGDQGRCSRRWPLGGFLSTPSARRATRARPAQWPGAAISIHALREEGDRPS